MLLPRSFAIGLLAYLRQAALSLHRAPSSFGEAMRHFYDAHRIPRPPRVLARLDALHKDAPSGISGLLQRLVTRALGTSIDLNAEDSRAVRQSLRDLDAVFEEQVEVSDAERIRIRMSLSTAEELVRRRLGRRFAALADKVEHLNETPGLGVRPLHDIAGVRWPEFDTE